MNCNMALKIFLLIYLMIGCFFCMDFFKVLNQAGGWSGAYNMLKVIDPEEAKQMEEIDFNGVFIRFILPFLLVILWPIYFINIERFD